MIIDIHAHAAGNYGSVDFIKNTAAKYDIGKIVLCTSPKNNQNLQEPPSMPFKQRPDSIYMHLETVAVDKPGVNTAKI